ncbi:regulatory GntR family protein [Haloactinopolyspora alba]|uniref:Regulatory GntR family protein n=1 Tax=Haloactinopolyspora alba TaxID=648780 RepID=A0A2P8EFD5_9ACTN|nr:GntR family transcriptional regulator [Haloactinopolyspora alba]PSL08187.1 regulatory GntR family protein [Haloactinopolyspora alba]
MKVRDEDPRPRYVQVADDLRHSITTGALTAGEKLPAARELAEEYGVAPMTAQKAVDVLKSEGVLYGAVGRGTFVRAAASSDDSAEPSADFTALMAEIEQLRAAVREQMGQLDQRLTKLEDEVHRPRQQDS